MIVLMAAGVPRSLLTIHSQTINCQTTRQRRRPVTYHIALNSPALRKQLPLPPSKPTGRSPKIPSLRRPKHLETCALPRQIPDPKHPANTNGWFYTMGIEPASVGESL